MSPPVALIPDRGGAQKLRVVRFSRVRRRRPMLLAKRRLAFGPQARGDMSALGVLVQRLATKVFKREKRKIDCDCQRPSRRNAYPVDFVLSSQLAASWPSRCNGGELGVDGVSRIRVFQIS
jgi:hypothetical protein